MINASSSKSAQNDSRITVGIRNQNPLNVKQSGSPWVGSIGTDRQGHAIFEDMAYGLRAAIRTIARKYAAGKTTIRKIIYDWAPASDSIGSLPGKPQNQPDQYAQFVAKRMVLTIDIPLKLFDLNGAIINQERLSVMICAMAEYENYVGFQVPQEMIMRGATLYEASFVRMK